MSLSLAGSGHEQRAKSLALLFQSFGIENPRSYRRRKCGIGLIFLTVAAGPLQEPINIADRPFAGAYDPRRDSLPSSVKSDKSRETEYTSHKPEEGEAHDQLSQPQSDLCFLCATLVPILVFLEDLLTTNGRELTRIDGSNSQPVPP